MGDIDSALGRALSTGVHKATHCWSDFFGVANYGGDLPRTNLSGYCEYTQMRDIGLDESLTQPSQDPEPFA
jgi:hypothetical protein